MRRIVLVLVLCPVVALAGKTKPCVAPDEAVKFLNKDICIFAHVYDVVRLEDGTNFLDVCAPEIPDDACRFTVVSLKEDRAEVGELARYRDADVHIRGVVQAMHGRTGMVLSHKRQFSGGPPKFKPNPKLLKGFAGDQEQTPVNDPNLRAHGGHRSFMNSGDRETLPGK